MSLVWMSFFWSPIFWTLLFALGTGSKFLTPFLLPHPCTPYLSFKIQVKISLSVKSPLTRPLPQPVLKWFLFSPVLVAPAASLYPVISALESNCLHSSSSTD